MQQQIVLIILLTISSAAMCGDDFLGTRASMFKNAEYQFDLSRSALAKAPHWETVFMAPPLAPRKAQHIALQQAKSLRPEVTNWNLGAITLQPIGDRGGTLKRSQ